MLHNTEERRDEQRVQRLLTDVVQELQTALGFAQALQGDTSPRRVGPEVLDAFQKASAAALAVADSLTLPGQEQVASELTQRAQDLVAWFSFTPQRKERVACVLSFFRDRSEPEPISLANLGRALNWTAQTPREEELIDSFRKLDCMRDVGMLIETRIGSDRLYALSDEARALICSGAFAGLGVLPNQAVNG